MGLLVSDLKDNVLEEEQDGGESLGVRHIEDKVSGYKVNEGIAQRIALAYYDSVEGHKKL